MDWKNQHNKDIVTGPGRYPTQVWLLAAQKANTRETSVGGKGKVALFRRPATWEDGGQMS